MVYKCVAAGCSNTSSIHTVLFKFPREPQLRQEWEKQVLRTRAHWKATESSFLCSEHFTDNCFEAESSLAAQFGIKKRKKLRSGAIPTIFVRQTFRNETAMSSCRKRGPESHGIEREPKRSAVEKRGRRQVLASVFAQSYIMPRRSWCLMLCKRLLRQQPLLI